MEIDTGHLEIDSGHLEMDTGNLEMYSGYLEMDSGCSHVSGSILDVYFQYFIRKNRILGVFNIVTSGR